MQWWTQDGGALGSANVIRPSASLFISLRRAPHRPESASLVSARCASDWGCGYTSLPLPLAALSTQLLAQQFVDLRRIRLAAAGFHDLADQGVEGLVLALAEFLYAFGVGRHDLVEDGL